MTETKNLTRKMQLSEARLMKSLLSRQKSGLKLKEFEGDFAPGSTINCIFRVKQFLKAFGTYSFFANGERIS